MVLSKVFCFVVPKSSWGDSCVSETFWYGRKLCIRGGVSSFSVGIFSLTISRSFVGNLPMFQKN